MDVTNWVSDNSAALQDASFLIVIVFLSMGILKRIGKCSVAFQLQLLSEFICIQSLIFCLHIAFNEFMLI